MKNLKYIFLKLVIICTLMFLGFACADQSGGGDSSETEADRKVSFVSIDLSASFNNSEGRVQQNDIGTADDVVAVKVKVEQASDHSEVLAYTQMTEDPVGSKNWGVTLRNIPVDVGLDFIAYAQDDQSRDIFQDTIAKTLTAGGNNGVRFEMESIGDGVSPSNPKILSANIPNEIENNSEGNKITFQISHSEVVEYSVEAERGTITSASSGTHDPSSDLVVYYTAPDGEEDDSITLRVKDLNFSDTVGAVYPINIVVNFTSSASTVIFGPSILGLSFLRTPTTLEVKLLTDPPTGLTHYWLGSGGFSSLYKETNPLILDPFSNTDTGQITGVATDANGLQAVLTRTIPAGHFSH